MFVRNWLLCTWLHSMYRCLETIMTDHEDLLIIPRPACVYEHFWNGGLQTALQLQGCRKEKKKKRRDYAFQRQFNEKPSLTLPCSCRALQQQLKAACCLCWLCLPACVSRCHAVQKLSLCRDACAYLLPSLRLRSEHTQACWSQNARHSAWDDHRHTCAEWLMCHMTQSLTCIKLTATHPTYTTSLSAFHF